MKNKKFIIDVCCGNKMFWFQKNHKNVLYLDNRKREKGFVKERPNFDINPDKVADFTDLSFIPNNSIKLVVFDPPHCVRKTPELGIITKKYGSLPTPSVMTDFYGILEDDWKDILSKGFKECWRILEKNGVLIFKWNEREKKLSEVLKLFSKTPLFGHTTGSRSQTKWLCFMKI
jgi:hypothetical protein